MLSFIVRSTLSRLALLLAASVLAHLIVHLAPGDPQAVDPMNPAFKPEDVARIRAAFHLDEPLHLQYVRWMSDLLSGELRTFSDDIPVLTKISQRFWNSLPLFLTATLIVWTLSFPVGIIAALRRGSL
ncbi:MAG: ABC transporter permease, partial [Gammaproteobacteria bacterium]|nr:ABC transporter permease [Gammaproteobacteria bacterium]